MLIRRLREAAINANLDAHRAPGTIRTCGLCPRRGQLIIE